MSRPTLIIQRELYELWLHDELLTHLAGGAAALLEGAGARLRELDIEAAIERAEDWIMPFSKSFEGLQLEVSDRTGRLRSHFGNDDYCSVPQIEQAFTRVHDEVAHMRLTDRDGAADVVLLRELAHHGRLSGILLVTQNSR